MYIPHHCSRISNKHTEADDQTTCSSLWLPLGVSGPLIRLVDGVMEVYIFMLAVPNALTGIKVT